MFKSRRYKEYPGESIDGNDGEGEKRGRIWDKDIAEDIETAAVNSFLSNTKTRTTYKHFTCIPRWEDVDGRFYVVSTWNTRGVFVGK